MSKSIQIKILRTELTQSKVHPHDIKNRKKKKKKLKLKNKIKNTHSQNNDVCDDDDGDDDEPLDAFVIGNLYLYINDDYFLIYVGLNN